MRELLDFSARTVRRRWRAVKGALREGLTVWTRHCLKQLVELELLLEEEGKPYLRGARHELGVGLGLVREIGLP